MASLGFVGMKTEPQNTFNGVIICKHYACMRLACISFGCLAFIDIAQFYLKRFRHFIFIKVNSVGGVIRVMGFLLLVQQRAHSGALSYLGTGPRFRLVLLNPRRGVFVAWTDPDTHKPRR